MQQSEHIFGVDSGTIGIVLKLDTKRKVAWEADGINGGDGNGILKIKQTDEGLIELIYIHLTGFPGYRTPTGEPFDTDDEYGIQRFRLPGFTLEAVSDGMVGDVICAGESAIYAQPIRLRQGYYAVELVVPKKNNDIAPMIWVQHHQNKPSDIQAADYVAPDSLGSPH